MELSFKGKTVIITGAASGMALLASRCFAENGVNVAMIDVNEQAVQEQGKTLEALYPDRILALCCDVRDYSQVEIAVKQAYDCFGSVDVMINLAGGAEYRMLGIDYGVEFPDCPIEAFDWSLDVNLRGQLYFDHAAMKYMREQKSGVVINIGSVAGYEGSTGSIAYSTAKSAVQGGLAKSLALYGAKYNIRFVLS